MTAPQFDFSMKYKKLDPNALPPRKAHNSDLGWDLFSLEDPIIPPFNSRLVRTGIAIGFPPNIGGILKDRSGVASDQGLFIHAGVIDPGYTGEILVLMYNSKKVPVEIKAGAKIAQMILMPVFMVSELKEVDQLDATDRGAEGFGSSGT